MNSGTSINFDGLQRSYEKIGELVEQMKNIVSLNVNDDEGLRQLWTSTKAQNFFGESDSANNDLKMLINEFESVRAQIYEKIQILREMNE